jgi:phosphoglycerate kinase
MGDLTDQKKSVYLKQLLTLISKSSAQTYICGGDSLAAVNRFGLRHTFTHCSTGGGVALAMIARASLPGLTALPD